MASALATGLIILAIGGLFVHLLVAWWRPASARKDQERRAFEKDIEWQLQSELDDAIDASSNASTPNYDKKHDGFPAPPSVSDERLHVSFSENLPSPGSRAELLCLYRTHSYQTQCGLASGVPTLPTPQHPSTYTCGCMNASHNLETHADTSNTESRDQSDRRAPIAVWNPYNFRMVAPQYMDEEPLFVNAKQFHRILKRRMARSKLEEALRLQGQRADRTRTRSSTCGPQSKGDLAYVLEGPETGC